MTVLRDITTEQFDQLRIYSKEGLSKTEAAKRLGVTTQWLNRSIGRLGLEKEWREMFPPDFNALNAFALDESRRDQVRRMTEAGMGAVQIAERFGTNRARLSDAIKRAGMVEEVAELRRLARARLKEYGPVLPREVDPAVKWLTREWRIAA